MAKGKFVERLAHCLAGAHKTRRNRILLRFYTYDKYMNEKRNERKSIWYQTLVVGTYRMCINNWHWANTASI